MSEAEANPADEAHAKTIAMIHEETKRIEVEPEVVGSFEAGGWIRESEWQASRRVTDEMVSAGVRALVASWDGKASTPDDYDLVRAILTAALETAS